MLEKYTVTLTKSLTVEIDTDQTTIADFLIELDDEIKSRSEGAIITEQHFISCEDKEIK